MISVCVYEAWSEERISVIRQLSTSMQGEGGEGGRRQMSMLGISMEKWMVLMIVIFLCCLGRKFTGPDEQNIQTIMGVIEAEPGLRHWGFTRDAEIHPVYNFLTANINLLQRTRGQRADRSCTIASLSCFLLVFKAYHLQRYFIRRVWGRDWTHSPLEYSRISRRRHTQFWRYRS